MGTRDKPVYSSRADDPALSESIDTFAIELAERIDHLQDAQRSGDLKELASLASSLVTDAESVGFDSLAKRAVVLEAACKGGVGGEAYDALLELTEIARRVRLGHRGAA